MESSLLVISFNFMFVTTFINDTNYTNYIVHKLKDTATISERQLQCRKVLWGGSLSQSSEPFLNEADTRQPMVQRRNCPGTADR